MTRFLFHPSQESLVAFTSGDESTRRHRVAHHLERCSECRQFVGFNWRLAKAAAALPVPAPREELLASALADRAAGARAILPALIEPAGSTRLRRAMGMLAVFVAAAILTVWWTDRGARTKFTSANELLLAGFAPENAEAKEPDLTVAAFKHRLHPLAVTYQRRFIDSASRRITDAGKFDLRVTAAESKGWVLTSAWREIDDQKDMGNADTWRESVTVADSTLAPARRLVYVKPYGRWTSIYIDQQFRNDSVVGQMSVGDDPRRRLIARDLRSQRDRLVASDAVASVYFMGVPLQQGGEFRLGALGWAWMPNDVIMPIQMQVVGSEHIDTPAGSFDCWKFVIRVGTETHYHWVRKRDQLGVRTVRRMSDGSIREFILLSESLTP